MYMVNGNCDCVTPVPCSAVVIPLIEWGKAPSARAGGVSLCEILLYLVVLMYIFILVGKSLTGIKCECHCKLCVYMPCIEDMG